MILSLTNTGLNMLLRAFAGDRITFTKVQIGNGNQQAAATASSLLNPLMDLPIDAITVGTANATIQTSINNAQVEAGFRCTEVGIFAKDQDDESLEVLYAYGSQPEDTADYISSSDDSILETQFDFLVFIGEAENVSAVINESLVYASAADLNSHKENVGNPHCVTKQQVGLGNVPNVTTNDQMPTYLDPDKLTSLQPLTSGEKLSMAFRKIARAVKALIAHIANKNNPHAVSPNQIGAAERIHTHTTSDIKKGVLGVARGGTGNGTWFAGRIPYFSTATAMSQLPFPSQNGAFLQQDTSGAPYWGAASEVGMYTGGNHSGNSDKSSIRFTHGLPHAVFIVQRGGMHWGALLLNPEMPVGFSVVNGVTSRLDVEISERTVSWFYDSDERHPANQLDAGLQKYAFIGIY